MEPLISNTWIFYGKNHDHMRKLQALPTRGEQVQKAPGAEIARGILQGL